MKLSLEWLSAFVRAPLDPVVLAEQLTMSGTEVEAIDSIGFRSDLVVTARIESFVQHPNADRLSVCQVNDGKGLRQIVCGAKNFSAGDVVPLALPGAELPGGFKIKESKLRGELSQGMMCSAKELGLGEGSEGLLLLDRAQAPGVPLHQVIPADTVLTLEVTPNRSDLLSVRGLAREIGALGYPLELPPVGSKASGDPADWTVRVESPGACPRYTLQVVRGIQVGPSPDWLRRRLEASGIRPINNVVDITNYVLLEFGQPLHAFDVGRLQGRTISVRQAVEGESFLALNGKTYSLSGDDLVIADEAGPVALAGVMGGEGSSVHEGTTEIVLESAAFSPGLVRTTSRRLALISDSSYRFERGIDPALVDQARNRALELLVEMAGATSWSQPVESAPLTIPSATVVLRPERLNRVLGQPMSPATLERHLRALGFASHDGQQWQVPSHRPDVSREIDLIEEVARLEGLEKIPTRTVFEPVSGSVADRVEARDRDLADLLSAWGYQEWVTSSLLPRKEAGEGTVRILNPLNEDVAVLRSNLLASGLPCVARNLAYGQKSVLAFEIGIVFKEAAGEPVEEKHLLVVAAGEERGDHWSEPGRMVDHFTVQGIMEALAERVKGLSAWKVVAVDPATRKAHGIKVPVFACEIPLKDPGLSRFRQYAEVSPFPAVRRDLAFVVDRSVTHQEILQTVKGCGIGELERIDVFDLFADDSGEKLPREKKSLAYALTYRSRERTLTEKDVAGWEARIIQAVSGAHGAVLRG
ncbi:MAG: phenylalanine--tRNA ligase subunit beta [Candidatus Methylacidiphilales bacterium]